MVRVQKRVLPDDRGCYELVGDAGGVEAANRPSPPFVDHHHDEIGVEQIHAQSKLMSSGGISGSGGAPSGKKPCDPSASSCARQATKSNGDFFDSMRRG